MYITCRPTITIYNHFDIFTALLLTTFPVKVELNSEADKTSSYSDLLYTLSKGH